MTWQTNCLRVFLIFIAFAVDRTDTRAILQDNFDEYISADPTYGNVEMLHSVVNYRHLFEHSRHAHVFRWMYQQQKDDKNLYCNICHTILPAVSISIHN